MKPGAARAKPSRPSRQSGFDRLLPLLLLPAALVSDPLAALPQRSYYLREFWAAFYPLRLFEARELLASRLPAWNPYVFEGTFLAPALYPLDLLQALRPGPGLRVLAADAAPAARGARGLLAGSRAPGLARRRVRRGRVLRAVGVHAVLAGSVHAAAGAGARPVRRGAAASGSARRRAKHRLRRGCRGPRRCRPAPSPSPRRRCCWDSASGSAWRRRRTRSSHGRGGSARGRSRGGAAGARRGRRFRDGARAGRRARARQLAPSRGAAAGARSAPLRLSGGFGRGVLGPALLRVGRAVLSVALPRPGHARAGAHRACADRAPLAARARGARGARAVVRARRRAGLASSSSGWAPWAGCCRATRCCCRRRGDARRRLRIRPRRLR